MQSTKYGPNELCTRKKGVYLGRHPIHHKGARHAQVGNVDALCYTLIGTDIEHEGLEIEQRQIKHDMSFTAPIAA
jgi:hypothetical protein